MLDDYLIVNKSILPDYFQKVIEARNLLESQKTDSVSEAVKAVGISRSTYYKYKDFVFSPSKQFGRLFTLTVKLEDVPGILSKILHFVTDNGADIVTINQGIPINGIALVTLTLDGQNLTKTVEEFVQNLKNLEKVNSVQLMALE